MRQEGNKKRSVYLVIACMFLSSCSPKSLEQKIRSQIEKACRNGNTCTMHMKEVTDFEWDKMFVFPYNVTEAEISKTIGMPLSNYEEFTRKKIFLKDGKIIYSEQLSSNVERLVDGEVVFDAPAGKTQREYDPNVMFQVSKQSFLEGVYYRLQPIE